MGRSTRILRWRIVGRPEGDYGRRLRRLGAGGGVFGAGRGLGGGSAGLGLGGRSGPSRAARHASTGPMPSMLVSTSALVAVSHAARSSSPSSGPIRFRRSTEDEPAPPQLAGGGSQLPVPGLVGAGGLPGSPETVELAVPRHLEQIGDAEGLQAPRGRLGEAPLVQPYGDVPHPPPPSGGPPARPATPRRPPRPCARCPAASGRRGSRPSPGRQKRVVRGTARLLQVVAPLRARPPRSVAHHHGRVHDDRPPPGRPAGHLPAPLHHPPRKIVEQGGHHRGQRPNVACCGTPVQSKMRRTPRRSGSGRSSIAPPP